MWTRSRNKETGLHSFEVRNPAGEIVATGEGYADHRDCDREAQMHERKLWMAVIAPAACDMPEMSDDELLAELMA
jgi:hypothetical protein